MPTGWGVVCAGTQSRIIFLDLLTKGRESIFFWANDGAAEEWPVASILNFKFRNLVVGFFVCVSCIVPFYVFFFFFFFCPFPSLCCPKINSSHIDSQSTAGLIMKLHQTVRCCENLLILRCVTCDVLIISAGLIVGLKND